MGRAAIEDAVAAAVPAGLRTLNKLDKRRRLVEAARAVIVEQGFEAATTREIAARAGVSVGTVFVYAKDKRDLLLMVVNDELDALTARGGAKLPDTGTLEGDLAAFFRARYRYWAAEPRLSRPTLHETAPDLGAAPEQGEQTQRFYARRGRVLAQLTALVERAGERGELREGVSGEQAAALLMDLYLIEVRRWLREPAPKAQAGVRRLLARLGLALSGVTARVAQTPR